MTARTELLAQGLIIATHPIPPYLLTSPHEQTKAAERYCSCMKNLVVPPGIVAMINPFETGDTENFQLILEEERFRKFLQGTETRQRAFVLPQDINRPSTDPSILRETLRRGSFQLQENSSAVVIGSLDPFGVFTVAEKALKAFPQLQNVYIDRNRTLSSVAPREGEAIHRAAMHGYTVEHVTESWPPHRRDRYLRVSRKAR